jgi:hypothetical protein
LIKSQTSRVTGHRCRAMSTTPRPANPSDPELTHPVEAEVKRLTCRRYHRTSSHPRRVMRVCRSVATIVCRQATLMFAFREAGECR